MMPVPPYGIAIQQAVASGDLKQMKQTAAAAEQHLKDHGDVRAALAVLKIEIAKLEHRAAKK